MPLTAADVHAVMFGTVRFGHRGYDLMEVDEFLDVVQADLTALYEQLEQARSVSPGAVYGASGDGSGRMDDPAGEQASRLADAELALAAARAEVASLHSQLAELEGGLPDGRHSAGSLWPATTENAAALRDALDDARRVATEAHAYAETVRGEAERALAIVLGEAQQSRDDAQQARQDAQWYQQEAEQARHDAQQHREDAERAREEAERDREEAERAREEAERAREEAEQVRTHMAQDSATLERLLREWLAFAAEQHRELDRYLDAQLSIVQERSQCSAAGSAEGAPSSLVVASAGEEAADDAPDIDRG